MLLYWNIRYWDGGEAAFKDRKLWLATESLSPETRAAVEASYELQNAGRDREILKHRHLFREENYSPEEVHNLVSAAGKFACVSVHDYFEDENGTALPPRAFAEAVTGRKGAVLFPAGAKPHDIAFALAEKPTVDLDAIRLTEGQLKALACFARDLREMVAAVFYKERPATLTIVGGGSQMAVASPAVLTTAASDEEIRSFAGIFRRLYMANEPGSFQNAAAVSSTALSVHPIGRWLAGAAAECAASMNRPPELFPFTQNTPQPFTLKRLIDVFIYTQYAHQPDDKRLRQFSECLRAVGDDRSKLTFHFLTGMWSLAHQFVHIGNQIVGFFDAYCRHHKTGVDIVASAATVHPGIGTLEKQDDTVKRILREKAVQLAQADWERAGRPENGYQPFVDGALARLKSSMGQEA